MQSTYKLKKNTNRTVLDGIYISLSKHNLQSYYLKKIQRIKENQTGKKMKALIVPYQIGNINNGIKIIKR